MAAAVRRSAGQRADPGRALDLRAVAGCRVAADPAAVRVIVARRVRGGRRSTWCAQAAEPCPCRSRSSGTCDRQARRRRSDRVLSPQPAEHVHRQATPAMLDDVSRPPNASPTWICGVSAAVSAGETPQIAEGTIGRGQRLNTSCDSRCSTSSPSAAIRPPRTRWPRPSGWRRSPTRGIHPLLGGRAPQHAAVAATSPPVVIATSPRRPTSCASARVA